MPFSENQILFLTLTTVAATSAAVVSAWQTAVAIVSRTPKAESDALVDLIGPLIEFFFNLAHAVVVAPVVGLAVHAAIVVGGVVLICGPGQRVAALLPMLLIPIGAVAVGGSLWVWLG